MDNVPAVPTARDIMDECTRTLTPETDVYEAIKLLLKRETPGLHVVDAEGHMVGVLTEKDCLRVLTSAAYSELAMGTVAHYMSSTCITAPPSADLFSLSELLIKNNYAAVAVVDKGKLVGRITRRSVLKGILSMERSVADKRKQGKVRVKLFEHPDSRADIQQLAATTKRDQLVEVLSRPHISRKGPEDSS
jgi:predicted transcriptional regulator